MNSYSWLTYSLFIALCLLLGHNASLYQSKLYPYGFKNPLLLEWFIPLFKNKLLNWDQSSLDVLLSYFLGTSLLPPKHELHHVHDQLYLSHLLSPSAFHLIGISWILKTFFSKVTIIIFWIILILIGWWILPLHPALLRSMAIVLIIVLCNDRWIKSKITLLLIYFIFDYFFGSFKLLPLSFVFSLIIIGNILLLPQSMSLSLKLFWAQIILSLIFSLKVQPLNFFIGHLLALIFLPLFTLIIIFVFLTPFNSAFLAQLLGKAFNIYLLIIQTIQEKIHRYLTFDNGENWLFLLTMIYFTYAKKLSAPWIFLLLGWPIILT